MITTASRNRSSAADRLRVIHVIPGTCVGGAEMMLLKVVSRLPRDEFDVHVVSLHPPGEIAERIQRAGIPVHTLNMSRRALPDPRALLRLRRLLRLHRPDIVQTWTYHADLYGGLAASLGRRIPVVWNIRHSTLERGTDSRNTRLSAKICAGLSRWVPARIVLNSAAACPVHVRAGYRGDKMLVIPNGFDLNEFFPDKNGRARIRKQESLPDDAQVIGLMGRFHPHKDHETFVSAAERIAVQYPHAHFLCAGDGVTWENQALSAWIDARGLRSRFRLLGSRSDTASVFAALDMAVCCSRTEGFPNVVGEAMACGVPCVATDVGDCRVVIGNASQIVPVGNPAMLAAGVSALLQLPVESLRRMGDEGRKRIAERFEINDIVRQYQQLWRAITGRADAPQREKLYPRQAA